MVIEIRYSFWPEYKQLDKFQFIISERLFIPTLQKNSYLLLQIFFCFTKMEDTSHLPEMIKYCKNKFLRMLDPTECVFVYNRAKHYVLRKLA
jgi:hypothetical protein